MLSNSGGNSGSGNIGTGIEDPGNDDKNVDVEPKELQGYIRSDSVMVSEWGLEHTLKLREEGKTDHAPLVEETEEDECNGEETKRKGSVPPAKLSTEDTGNGEETEEDLPLPSTPVITSKPPHKTDWWSQALAESGGMVDDYDSLIENLETKEEPAFIQRKVHVR